MRVCGMLVCEGVKGGWGVPELRRRGCAEAEMAATLAEGVCEVCRTNKVDKIEDTCEVRVVAKGMLALALVSVESDACPGIWCSCMYVRMYACMHVCMYVYVCMYLQKDGWMCLPWYLLFHICMHVRTYVCIHACMYACMVVFTEGWMDVLALVSVVGICSVWSSMVTVRWA